MAKDYYAILGIPRGASAEEIKKAYRKLAHQHHPDKGGGDEAKFKEVNEAYQVLSDPQKKQQYDQFGQTFDGPGGGGFGQGFPGGGFEGGFSGAQFDFGNMEDILGSFFGGGGRQRQNDRRGRDLVFEVTLSLKDAVFGSTQQIKYKRSILCGHCGGKRAEPGTHVSTCSTCKGSGQVIHMRQTILGSIRTAEVCSTCGGAGESVATPCSRCHGDGLTLQDEVFEVSFPAGIDHGQTLRIQGRGSWTDPKGTAGDLLLEISISPDTAFSRDHFDLLTTVGVSFPILALGGEITVRTLDDQHVAVSIPAGTASGSTFKVRHHGAPKLQREGRGDLIVTVEVIVPKKVDRHTKELLRSLDESLSG